MALQEEFESIGNRLFQWRSYLPLFMAFLFVLALLSHRYHFGNQKLETVWELGCLGISFLGLLIRFFTVGFVPRGTSGRNTRGQVADLLNTSGMYSIVRNPIYLGNFIIWFGLSLFIKTWWFTVLIMLFFTIFYERIIFAEESFLREKFGNEFLNWAEVTPAIFPKIKNWKPPDLSFSWKSAINREYASFFAIIVSFTIVKIIGNLLDRRFPIDTRWAVIFILGAIIYCTIRFFKKKTGLLRTADR